MICKFLESKVKLEMEEGIINEKNSFELEYYLIESEENEMQDFPGTRVYGIEIIKKLNTGIEEKERVRNFSFCRDQTRNMLEKLSKNTVTPVGLPFVIDDFIGA